MSQGKVAVWILFAAAILLMVAALIPVLKGETMNVTFLGAGVVFFVIAAVAARKARDLKRKSPV